MFKWMFKKKKNVEQAENNLVKESNAFSPKHTKYKFNDNSQTFTQIVSTLQESKKHTAILCYPTLKGELVYSLAIALIEAGVSSLKFHIIGLNEKASIIERAQYGTYDYSTIGEIDRNILRTYFNKVGDKYKIVKAIQGVCSFKNFDINKENIETLGQYDFVITNSVENSLKLNELCKNEKAMIIWSEEDFKRES